MLIEYEGLLYRGPATDNPTDIWDYPRARWVPYRQAGFEVDGRRITAAEASLLKKNNPAAEHFRYYDTPPWSQPLSEAYLEAVTPEHIKKRIAELRAGLASPDATTSAPACRQNLQAGPKLQR